MATVHTGLGKRIGSEGSYSRGGMFTLKERHALKQGNEWYPDTPIVLSGLQLRLDAANPLSYPGTGSTWFDLSGNGFNAELINSPTWVDQQAGYFNVNAASIHTFKVSKPNPGITGQITTEAWVYFDNFEGSPTLIHKGGHYTLQILASGTAYFWADASTYSYSTFGSRNYNFGPTGTWKQIVVTKDTSNNVRLYVNGALVDTRVGFGSALSHRDTSLWLIGYADGETNPPSSNLITGRFSVAHVYNRQLSDAEVLQNFNAIRGRYGI